MDGKKSQSETIQAVDRALAVLEAVSRLGAASLNDLHGETGLNKPSLLRLAGTLVADGYLGKNEVSGQYALTFKAYEVGIRAVQSGNQFALVNTVLSDLSRETGLVAQFSIEDRGELICLQSIGRLNPIFSAYTEAGKRSTLYSTSAGKAILATYPNAEVIKKWEGFDVRPLTPHTHTDVQSLLRDLGEIRRRGYAVDREENEYSLFCVGSVVMNHARAPIGAISVSTGALAEEDEKRLSAQVMAATLRLSALLGYASE